MFYQTFLSPQVKRSAIISNTHGIYGLPHELPNDTILSCFFFLIIDLYFLTPAVLAQIFNLIAELVIPLGIPSNEAKTEIEIHAVIAEAKIRKGPI